MESLTSAATHSTVESRLPAGLDGWRGFFLIFLGWPILGAVGVWALTHHFRVEPTLALALGLWALISGVGIIATWATVRTAYIAVTPDRIQIGHSPRETIVDFSEIESLIEGLPAQASLIMKIGRLSHHNELAVRRMAMMRREAILLRLTGGRFLALYISSTMFANAHTLRMALLERNRHKIVGADSYMPVEVRRMANVAFNTIGMF